MHPVIQALIATCFCWLVTAVGAATVFGTRHASRRTMDALLGFAGGVMLSAAFWSLLGPAVDMSGGKWMPATAGFLLGAGVMRATDLVLPHVHHGAGGDRAEGIGTQWRRTTLLVLAITLHNIPEGLAVGVGFGAVGAELSSASMGTALALTLGIALQNVPEGLAVAMPLRRAGYSRLKSFWYGQLSASVQPVAGVIGAAAVLAMQALMPYALGFAAGAMVFVVLEDVVPEANGGGHANLATAGGVVGFALMMVLDIALS
ncbi:MAG: ZIP family metal transporter [Dehalococcoidia bacterium]|jgi:ZIP family zinc transporter|nr:ZIP family metal transporter [Dehalococcoidia bacterium]